MPLQLSPISNLGAKSSKVKLPISLLAGEMSGRTEGGGKDRYVDDLMHVAQNCAAVLR